MARIFISYRTEDTGMVAGRLDDRLSQAFDADNVIRDLDAPFGVDIRGFIAEQVGRCDAVLVLIGSEWAGMTNSRGERLLDDYRDPVRIQVETGLQRNVLVVPVLVGDASMPRADELPDDMRRLAYLNATPLRNDPDFSRDMERLITGLQNSLGVQAAPDPAAAGGADTNDPVVAPIADVVRVLFLGANPADTRQLRLDEEVRTIDERLYAARYRDRFDLESAWAVRTGDISGHLLRFEPHIVHFSGHGSRTGELVFEDAAGGHVRANPDALTGLFRALRDEIRCVVLNACYSERQALAILDVIGCVVGTSRAIDDSAAIAFSGGFYRTLGYGRSVQQSFDVGCAEAGLDGGDISMVRLLTRPDVDAAQMRFV